MEKVKDPELAAKFSHLRQIIQKMGKVVVAYSGGVDSSLLAAVCLDVLGQEKMCACLAVSPSLAEREKQEAQRLAENLGMPLHLFQGTEFQNQNYLQNDSKRCYYCKSDLYQHLSEFAKTKDFNFMLFGGNLDDLGDYRPGQQAAAEYGARAPLAEAGLTKPEIRALSKQFGLPTHSKPAFPCLSSRLPYGSTVTVAKLDRIERAEDLLFRLQFTECRVRHEEQTARIEVPEEDLPKLLKPEIRQKIIQEFKKIGFNRIHLDMEGLRSGNLNAELTKNQISNHS